MNSNRRQFERLHLTAEAIATDEAGQRLGLVSHAGGGGMAIALDAGIDAQRYPSGTRMRVTVFEPENQVRNTVTIEVRYTVNNVLGVQFADESSSVL